MILYKTAAREGSASETISRSKFIAYVKPVDSYEEGQRFVAEIKEKHRDATHNVPAIICGNKQELQWMSDDGEPQGTAGPPVLKLLADEGLTNIAVVVTRYFGGIKLGTGGLVRAYQGVAKKALEEVGIAAVSEGVTLEYEIDYTYLDKIKSLSRSSNFEISDEKYSERVTITIQAKFEMRDRIKALFNDVTSGKCVLISEKNNLFKSKIC